MMKNFKDTGFMMVIKGIPLFFFLLYMFIRIWFMMLWYKVFKKRNKLGISVRSIGTLKEINGKNIVQDIKLIDMEFIDNI